MTRRVGYMFLEAITPKYLTGCEVLLRRQRYMFIKKRTALLNS